MSDLSFDVVCVGGALIGTSVAYWLSENPDFDGTIGVIETDQTYDKASSSRSQNSIREQFSTPMNIKISQFGMEFFDDFHNRVQVDGDAPKLNFMPSGYLFLAGTDAEMDEMRDLQKIQHENGAMTEVVDADELARQFPYLDVSELKGGRLGTLKEGTLDGWSFLLGLKQRAIANGVTYIADTVTGIDRDGSKVTGVNTAAGHKIAAGAVVNASGSRAKVTAEMVGLDLPVEPRSRSSFIFSCRSEIPGRFPLTIAPEGVHFRRDQQNFVSGTQPDDDIAIAYDDWDVRGDEFEEKIWPVLAKYVPQFDRVAVVTSWGGHYAYNTLDHNVIVGTSSEIDNFYFANGFSGHGLQQSPAVGRAVSELITYGEYRTLDLSPLDYGRIERNEPYVETAVI